MSGCSAVWLAHFLGVEEVAGSSPVTPTSVKYPIQRTFRVFIFLHILLKKTKLYEIFVIIAVG